MSGTKKWHNYSDVQVDSKWEGKLKDGILSSIPYHCSKIGYSIDHVYHPDWALSKASGRTIYIEAKGRFRTSAEASKYIWVRKVLTSKEELVFLFMNPTTAMPFAKKRRDGTKRTHAEWAESNKFRWYTEKTIGVIL